MKSRKKHTRYLVGVSMFSAMAYGVAVACMPLKVSFLSFDVKDALIALASFIYGPLSAILMAGVVSLLEFLTISSTGAYGLIMNFASSATFSVCASLVYRYKRTAKGALVGLSASVLMTTAVMMLLNIFVTPGYMGVPRSAVLELIPTLLLPFNLAKALLNSALVMYLYKPVSVALRRSKLDVREAFQDAGTERSAAADAAALQKSRRATTRKVSAVATVILIVALAVLITLAYLNK
ncbi:MAG: ECF transporter S component [Clostridia bacterium]|nr:ECF transporter S component [Clostridia bacterium]